MTLPAVDGVTPQALVVLQDRPVVPFTQWVADALRVCGETGRGLQIVTPPETRLTMPLRLVLTGPGSHWVVRDDGNYYDGLTGTGLQWDGAAFTPLQGSQASAYTQGSDESPGLQLTVTVRARHAPESTLGSVAEQLCLALTGEPPGGWGTAEPATGQWNRDDLTELHRRRLPRATWLTAVGAGQRPAIATMLLTPAESGVEEAVTLIVGYEPSEDPPVGALPTLVGALALECTILSVFAQLAPGRADLTVEPRWTGNPGPIGMAVGGGASTPAAPPQGIRSQQLGDMSEPTTWYELGDGRSQTGWQRYQALLAHLQSTA